MRSVLALESVACDYCKAGIWRVSDVLTNWKNFGYQADLDRQHYSGTDSDRRRPAEARPRLSRSSLGKVTRPVRTVVR